MPSDISDPMVVVTAWDASLRAGDWSAARASLADDATYVGGADEEPISCTNADQIVALLRSWKGKLPDVEVVEWGPIGSRVLAQLRQPAFGDDADWFQVLTVRDGLISRLEDHPTREAALAAIESAQP